MMVKNISGKFLKLINKLAQQMDQAIDSKNIVIIEAAINQLLSHKEDIENAEKSAYYYILSNAYSALRHINYISRKEVWNWNKDEYNREILYLRKGIDFLKFDDGTTDLKQRLLTNYGNTLNHYGRFVEATDEFKKAIEDRPFGMAFYLNAECLRTYGGLLYDGRHQQVFLSKIMELTENALKYNLENGAEGSCRDLKSWLSGYSIASIDSTFYNSFALGKSKKEREYRVWCANNTLFLNPLNDLFNYSIVSNDVLGAPSIVYKVGDNPYFHSFYNQLKQEYISARWLLFEGLNLENMHFSDRDTVLHETYDNSMYCLAIEKIKSAFRIQYSIFDKIAFFIAKYFQIDDLKDHQIDFKKIWYSEKKLREIFDAKESLPLLALFRMSKDFMVTKLSTDFDTEEPIDTFAQRLWEIRNTIEHKYLRVQYFDFSKNNLNDISTEITYDELIELSRIMTKKVRAALIYLSLAVHQEEELRKKSFGKGIILPMGGSVLQDKYKKII